MSRFSNATCALCCMLDNICEWNMQFSITVLLGDIDITILCIAHIIVLCCRIAVNKCAISEKLWYSENWLQLKFTFLVEFKK